jgi:hypothetical protein
MQQLCLLCGAHEAVWARTKGPLPDWLLAAFCPVLKGLSSIAAFLLLCALQALPVNVKGRIKNLL